MACDRWAGPDAPLGPARLCVTNEPCAHIDERCCLPPTPFYSKLRECANRPSGGSTFPFFFFFHFGKSDKKNRWRDWFPLLWKTFLSSNSGYVRPLLDCLWSTAPLSIPLIIFFLKRKNCDDLFLLKSIKTCLLIFLVSAQVRCRSPTARKRIKANTSASPKTRWALKYPTCRPCTSEVSWFFLFCFLLKLGILVFKNGIEIGRWIDGGL